MSVALGGLPQASVAAEGELKAFQARVDQYVEMHRRVEGRCRS